jgi:hypothetical protein
VSVIISVYNSFIHMILRVNVGDLGMLISFLRELKVGPLR